MLPENAKPALGKVSVLKSAGDLLISVPHQSVQLSIYDLHGVLMMRRQIEELGVIPVEHFAQKPYVVKITIAGQKIYQKIFR